MKAINGETLDDGVDEPWTCPHCGLTEELCDCDESAVPMEDRWDYDHGPDHMREVIEDSLHNETSAATGSERNDYE